MRSAKNLKIHEQRRARFFDEMEKHCENSIAVIPAHPELIRNDDVHFKFRQDSNFFYLTGFEEPDAIAVLKSVGGKREFTLFVKPKDLAKEIWTGYLCGVEGAMSTFKANKSYSIDDFDSQMSHLFAGCERVSYELVAERFTETAWSTWIKKFCASLILCAQNRAERARVISLYSMRAIFWVSCVCSNLPRKWRS